jgi:serine/threonine protein kinase
MLFPIKEEGAMKIEEVIWFDRYMILSELGRGSGSIVYLARHQKLGEYRVIKQIMKNTDSTWKIREAEILNYLKHPKIPEIYDIEEDETAYYIIEEYIEGESLEALMLQSSFISPDFIYYTLMDVAEILDYMHHIKPNPMIYQDLKSEHIISGKEGIKLIDFGIAVCLGEMGNKFQNYGTPKFCAPEKAEEAKVNIQTDIYSIGKLLEELIYAEADNMSHHLMHIAKRAMSPDLSNRYHSMREFMADLTKQMQSTKKSHYQKHLLKKIIVTGSQPRIGTTHLSISFTEYLNRKNIVTVYRETNTSETMRNAIEKGNFTKEGGLYRRGEFLGMPAYGEGVCVDIPKDAVEILDYGTDLKGALSEKADLFLFVAGSREWEIKQTDLIYQKIRNSQGLVLISNYGNKSQAKKYAREYNRKVYCFPLDENPFYMTKEKEKLFDGLLEKESKISKNNWICRKHPRMRRNALVCGSGKLCSGRTE